MRTSVHEKRNDEALEIAKKKNSCPKARDGHWYPCPALVLCNGSYYVSRAAAPVGTGWDKVL